MPYKFLEKLTRADIAFQATGKTLAQLFNSAAKATIESMANTKTIKPKIKKEIKIENKDNEKLLYEFLEEIIYLKDVHGIVFKEAKCKIKQGKLTATLTGDKINHKTQELHQDVKAATMHNYFVKKTTTGWKAQVVLDI